MYDPTPTSTPAVDDCTRPTPNPSYVGEGVTPLLWQEYHNDKDQQPHNSKNHSRLTIILYTHNLQIRVNLPADNQNYKTTIKVFVQL